MKIYLGLALVSVFCFLPHYLLNFRERPNPFEFLSAFRFNHIRGVKPLYTKWPFSDPFRVNFDYTFLVLAAVFLGLDGTWVVILLALVLVASFLVVVYASIMHAIFKRPPGIRSDLSLLRTGMTLGREYLWALAAAMVLILCLISASAFLTTKWIMGAAPAGRMDLAVVALLLIAPCVYHWRSYGYPQFFFRTIYSPTLHVVRNLRHSEHYARYQELVNRDSSYFKDLNPYRSLRLENPPNVVIIAIESYGSIVYRQQPMADAISPLLGELQARLADRGLHCASAYSRAPLFTGGSWLSYTTLTYGIKVDDVALYDLLFGQESGFSAYESLFHILQRNSFTNYLLAPLGGVDDHEVEWSVIERCFQSDVIIDVNGLEYSGPVLPYLALGERFSPPDEYSLNRGYEIARQTSEGPFSMFYLTLNSHFPYNSPVITAGDWRSLNCDDVKLVTTADRAAGLRSRYQQAMQYQLRVIGEFIERNATDNTVFVVFGDHQPPQVATEDMGPDTQVHIISPDSRLNDVFLEHGFARSLVLDNQASTIHHEGFLTLFLKAMGEAYGRQGGDVLPYFEQGIKL